MHWIARTSVVLVTTFALAALAVVDRDALARFLLLPAAGAATGTSISVASLHIDARRTTIEGLRVLSSRGEPVADVRRIVATYDLREAFPGGKRFLGLSEIDVVRPRITLLRRADGTFAFPTPSSGGQGNPAPWHMKLRLDDGSLAFTDETRVDPASRVLRVAGIALAADIDVDAVSRYTASLAYREDDRSYPAHGSGTIDALTGFNAQHWSAQRIPLARLVNYGANSPQLRADAGDLSAIDARFLAFAGAEGGVASAHPHLAAHATLAGLRVAIKGLNSPASDIGGSIDAYENGVLAREVTARVGDVPVRISGGIFNFAHPTLRVNASGRASFAQLRRLVPSIARTPLDGTLAFSAALEGDAAQPRTFVSISAPRVAFNGVPLDRPHGALAIDASEADILDFRTRYGAGSLTARGSVAFSRKNDTLTMLAHVDAPANLVPYASGIVPGMALRADVLARGDDPQKIDALGALYGKTRTQTLAGTFDVDEQGVGTVGPVFIGNDRHWLYARATLDHPHNRDAALIGTRDLRIQPVASAAFANARLALPPIGGTLDANLFGALDGSRFGVVGDARASNASVAGFALGGEVDARLSGDLGAVRIASLRARGPWGRLDGAGEALFGPNETVAQIRDANISPARAPHLSIRNLDATIGVRANGALRIYAARAQAAGGEIALSGNVQDGSGIAVVAQRLDPNAFVDFGSPLRSGKLSLAATLRGSAAHPLLNGVFVLDGSHYGNAPINADARLAFADDTFSVRDAVMRAGPSVLDADGAVAGLHVARRSFDPRYDLHVRLRAADAHEAALLAQPSYAHNVEGSVQANLRVGGAGSRPRVVGSIRVPEASYHGLAMSDLSGNLDADLSRAALSAHATFGSTAVAFGGSAANGGDAQAYLRAPRTDLEDFNDFFDPGDMLAGRGSVDLSARLNAGRLHSAGTVAFSEARAQRFLLDAAKARWSSSGRTIAFSAQANAANERARMSGTTTLPPTRLSLQTLPNAALRSVADVRVVMNGVDLAQRLPQFGISAPVTGLLDVNATAHGRYPDLDLAARADLRDGTAARVPIERLSAAGSLIRGRGFLKSAQLRIASLQADASGSFGLHPGDRTNILARASSANLGTTLKEITHRDTGIAGSFDTTLRIGGTQSRPTISDNFLFSSLRYRRFVVPRIRGEIAADRKTLALRGGEIDLAAGRILASGNVALASRSDFDASKTPVAFTLAAENAEASNFVPLAPQGTAASGRLDGRVRLSGTIGRPRFDGLLTFANGSLAQPKQRVPLTDVGMRLAFAGTDVTLQSFHAQAGGGTADATGTLAIPDLQNAEQTRLRLNARADKAVVDIPGTFKGRVSGDMSIKRDPGSIPAVDGRMTVSQARIPMTAVLPSGSSQASKPSFDLAFGVQLLVGDDVRMQSSNLDVGAKGRLALSGTLSAPTLAGRLKSTGGSMDFYRHFDLQSGTLAFDPSQGVIPNADIVATTTIPSPQTAVTLRATGPATNLNVQLASDPSYSRDQILGLLVGAQQIGAISGVANTGGGTFSASSALQQTAMGQVNQAFTRNLLEPLAGKLGSSLGLENLQLTNNVGGAFNANAVKKLGKRLDASFAESFGTVPRSSISFDFRPKAGTFLNLTAYQQAQTGLNAFSPPQIAGNDPSQQGATQLQSMEGAQGFLFSLQRRWFP